MLINFSPGDQTRGEARKPIKSKTVEDLPMLDSIKNLSFADIETAIKRITKSEYALLDHLTSQMKSDLELLKALEALKSELTNILSVK